MASTSKIKKKKILNLFMHHQSKLKKIKKRKKKFTTSCMRALCCEWIF